MSILLRRRELIAALGGAAAWPLAVSAQQPTKPTIGWLSDALPPRDSIEAFRRGLAEIGLLEGRDVTVEYQTTDGLPKTPSNRKSGSPSRSTSWLPSSRSASRSRRALRNPTNFEPHPVRENPRQWLV